MEYEYALTWHSKCYSIHVTQPVAGVTGTASCDNGLERSSPRTATMVNQGSEMCASNINKTERDVDLIRDNI